jgi:cell division protein FtsX
VFPESLIPETFCQTNANIYLQATMEHFQIEPGPKVSEILRIAQNIHKLKIMEKEELLRELDNRVGNYK